MYLDIEHLMLQSCPKIHYVKHIFVFPALKINPQWQVWHYVCLDQLYPGGFKELVALGHMFSPIANREN